MRLVTGHVTSGTLFALGRLFFGAATAASGVLQLASSDFVRLVQPRPAWLPAHSVWPHLFGLLLVALGLAILSGRMTRTAAAVLGGVLLPVVLLLYVPPMIWNAQVDRPLFRGFMWTNPLKTLALIGGTAILARSSPGEPRPLAALVRALGSLEPAGPALLALFLVVCGVQHFVYADFVLGLVPSWIPPGQRFWTYATGVALVAGGAGILVRPTARLAATLSALMIFLWVLLLHIPRALAGPNHANETAGVFEALALSGVALLAAKPRARR